MDFAVIGLGSRGSLYANIIKEKHPDCKIVAVCDVEEYRLKVAKEKYGISDDMLFTNEDDFFAKGKLADALIIDTIDKAHYKEAIRAMEVGYDMIMEKPMSPDQEERKEIVATAKKPIASTT
jgi:predicted dehydrogenase